MPQACGPGGWFRRLWQGSKLLRWQQVLHALPNSFLNQLPKLLCAAALHCLRLCPLLMEPLQPCNMTGSFCNACLQVILHWQEFLATELLLLMLKPTEKVASCAVVSLRSNSKRVSKSVIDTSTVSNRSTNTPWCTRVACVSASWSPCLLPGAMAPSCASTRCAKLSTFAVINRCKPQKVDFTKVKSFEFCSTVFFIDSISNA